MQTSLRRLYLLILLALDSVDALQTPSSYRLDRAVQKVAVKLEEFGRSGNHPTLVIDGNNVRGIGKFQWNPIELQHRVSFVCGEFGIPRAVIVWDHGSCRFATAIQEQQQDVDVVIIFSGLSQRADDVIVKEAGNLVSSFSDNQWSSLAFVTNDGGLASRLRKKSLHQDATKQNKNMALVIDSTRFFHLLSRMEGEGGNSYFSSSKTCENGERLALAMERIQESFRQFAALQKIGYNPRREKTWERCVLAERMRRTFCSLDNIDGGGGGAFAKQYIKDLETRGYTNIASGRELGIPANDTVLAIPGSTRLDKKQKRLLTKYNRAREKGLLGGET